MNSSANALVVERTKQIVDLHLGIEASLRRSVQDAIKLGELLTEQKVALSHGEFLPWIERELPFNERTAQRYMLLFRYKPKCDTLSDLRTAYEVAQIEDQRQHPKAHAEVAPEIIEAERERHDAFVARMAEEEEAESEPTIDVDDLLKRAHETVGAARRGNEAARGSDPSAAIAVCAEYIDTVLAELESESARHMVVNGLIKHLREMSVNLNRKVGVA